MANTGYIKFNTKDIVSVIQEETADKLTQSEADNLYLGKTDKAVSAGSADTSTKATQDANGNVITNTYATKTEVASTYATKTEVPVITSGTTDLEAGTSPLATGTYYFVYE